MNPVSLAKQHPAETAMPLATALAALICSLLGVEDTDTILYLAIVLSFVPAVVTWVVGIVDARKVETTMPKPSSRKKAAP